MEDVKINGPVLSTDAVVDLMVECLGEQGVRGQAVVMFGITYVLDVRGREQRIRHLLEQLPDVFRQENGYAHSAIGAVFDREGKVWAENMAIAMHLLAMGTACVLVEEAFPARMRADLPASVPYYRVLLP